MIDKSDTTTTGISKNFFTPVADLFLDRNEKHTVRGIDNSMECFMSTDPEVINFFCLIDSA